MTRPQGPNGYSRGGSRPSGAWKAELAWSLERIPRIFAAPCVLEPLPGLPSPCPLPALRGEGGRQAGRGWFMGRGHLQNLDVNRSHEPWRSGVSAERRNSWEQQPAALCRDAATGRRFMESLTRPPATLSSSDGEREGVRRRFMESFDLQFWTRIETMNGGARLRRAPISQRHKLGLDGVSPHPRFTERGARPF